MHLSITLRHRRVVVFARQPSEKNAPYKQIWSFTPTYVGGIPADAQVPACLAADDLARIARRSDELCDVRILRGGRHPAEPAGPRRRKAEESDDAEDHAVRAHQIAFMRLVLLHLRGRMKPSTSRKMHSCLDSIMRVYGYRRSLAVRRAGVPRSCVGSPRDAAPESREQRGVEVDDEGNVELLIQLAGGIPARVADDAHAVLDEVDAVVHMPMDP